MSAFLGPIHYWLYNKILLQEEWIHSILEVSVQEGWNTLSEQELDTAYGKLDLSPLEEIIDGSNIHGWLQQKIEISENRLAFLVTSLLNEDSSRLADLKQAAFQFGEKHALQNGIGADDAFKVLEDTLLDGMPCDHVNSVMEHDTEKVVWQKTQCVHHEYWDRAGGNISVYDTLRGEIVAGMLSRSGLELHTYENNKYEISRKE